MKSSQCLTDVDVYAHAAAGLAKLALDGQRVLVLIPDGTRSMPMSLFFDVLSRELSSRCAAVDFLVALGTHKPMTGEQLSRHLGHRVVHGCAGAHRVYNHRWDDPAAFVQLGTIPAREIEQLTDGLFARDVDVTLNRLILDYDHLLICGPVFPHEVAGFSGGAKYFFPGIAGPEIIHFTHWLGALLTSYDIIGVQDTAVRRVIHRAAEFIPKPHSLLAPVVTHDGVEGVFCGPTIDTWSAAAALSAQHHIVWLDRPIERALAVLPTMYDDLWTGAKGMYKLEPAIADGGEVCIYAPHITEVSYVHGRMIDEIGYHCRDYFLAQWDRFCDFPGGILAHSTHVRGKGTYVDGVEQGRITVTLATGIPEERCGRIALGYRDPASIRREEWTVIERAGETLYRARS